MANNMYVLSRALTHAGYTVCFIRDRNDRYAFSQPVWEDCSFTLSYQEVIESSSWSWEEWNVRETDERMVSPPMAGRSPGPQGCTPA